MEQEKDYIIHLEQFDGPLDVLLFLIQKSKVDLMELSITEITDQYVAYIKSLQALNLEVASEYLLMSAQLIEMKSKMLLPKQKTDDDEEEDPREALIQRLLEYKKYKEVTKTFKEYEHERQQVYSKPLSDLNEWVQNETLLNSDNKKDIYQLVHAFENMLARQKLIQTKSVTMTKNEITIEEQIDHIELTLTKKKRVSMSEMVANKNRGYIVTTFLAILQLVRTHKVSVIQNELFDDIEITKGI